MELLTCHWCDAKGTPQTMRWSCIIDEIQHPEAEPLPGPTHGPTCPACSPSDAETVRDAGEEPVPTEADYDLAERMHGDEGWVVSLLDDDDWTIEENWVPYGEGEVLEGTYGEPRPGAIRDALERAWENGELEWAVDPEREGQMLLALVTNETKGGR